MKCIETQQVIMSLDMDAFAKIIAKWKEEGYSLDAVVKAVKTLWGEP